jgi:acylphosphatase
MVTKSWKVIGKVQGVRFRESLREQAKRLGVTGWVRNCRDGSVEVFAQGMESLVEELKEWSAKGPPMAKVDRIEDIPCQSDTPLLDFLRKPDA